jgi:hypothetical protein
MFICNLPEWAMIEPPLQQPDVVPEVENTNYHCPEGNSNSPLTPQAIQLATVSLAAPVAT